MKRGNELVPFGYEPEASSRKGSLLVYDSFEAMTLQELANIVQLGQERKFTRVVFYPLHEETVKRMTRDAAAPYHRRVEKLEQFVSDHGKTAGLSVDIDRWEGKRKKYTPIDTALRHLTEVYAGPHFLYLTAECANLFASFSSFEEWIKRVRLLVSGRSAGVHSRLMEYENRWETAPLSPVD